MFNGTTSADLPPTACPGTRLRLPVDVQRVSLVGTDTDSFPVGWGNYFRLVDGTTDGLRVCNMWWENLEEAARRWLPDNAVDLLVWCDGEDRRFAIVDDARIPAEWYYNRMCWTGYGYPSLEVARAMFAVRGDPTNELELWTDPDAYHARRGERRTVEGTNCYVTVEVVAEIDPDMERFGGYSGPGMPKLRRE